MPHTFAECENLTHVYCLAKKMPITIDDIFEGSNVHNATLHVPDALVSTYKSSYPWNNFGTIVGLGDGTDGKCATPTINYADGKITFSCATEGVEFVSDITDTDITRHYGAEIDLSLTYNISVYATKDGMEASDVATATLCWIGKDPTLEDGIGVIPLQSASPLLIQSHGGSISVSGAADGTTLKVYTIDGRLVSKATTLGGVANVNTNLTSGTVTVVQVGQKSVKMLVR